MTNKNIRNIAIIAHVDHGKTTLVDCMLKQGGAFRENQQVQERVLDSNDLERERGITILSKNISIDYKGTKINVVDTPGHADFGGEVERVLGMVDGALLIVDAAEGPMPQTRFVLSKALELGIKIIVVINKIDKPAADPDGTLDKVFDLFTELTDREDLIDFPYIYSSSLNGYAIKHLDDEKKDMVPLLDCIIENIQAPSGDADKPFQFRATTLDYNEYVGRIVIGRVVNGRIHSQDQVAWVKADGSIERGKVTKLFGFKDLGRVEINESEAGDIVGIAGFSDIHIGETLCDPNNINPLPLIHVDEPTLQMNFSVNDSPFAGQEGKFVTSRQLRKRLYDELEKNVSLRVEDTDSTDCFKVSGRGELHLGILIETMRREGYEFAVSKAEVLYHTDERGKKLEPIELAYIDVPEEFSGSVIQKLSQRKGELLGMTPINGGYTRLQFSIPSRGLIGYRGEFMTDTKGNGIINTSFEGYEEYKGDISYRKTGSLIAYEDGEAVTYGLFNAQDRGTLFIGPGEKVYAGMIIGENPRTEDIEVNVCKTKHLTNTRSSSADEALRLVPPKIMSLEQCLDYIDTDELLEITPTSLRIRKKILDPTLRKRAMISRKNS